jgi:hypothetical protein
MNIEQHIHKCFDVLIKLDDKKYVPPKDVFYDMVDGHKVAAFPLLAKTKQARFTIHKTVIDITPEDIYQTTEKALSYVTRKDFAKFRKSVEGLKTSLQYTDDVNGFTNYLFTLIHESGLYHLLYYLYKVQEPNATIEETVRAHTTFSIKMFDGQKQLADRIYAEDREYGKTLQGVMLNELARMGRRTGADGLKMQDALIFDGEKNVLTFMSSSKYGGVAMTIPMQKVLSMYHEELCKVLPADLSELGKVSLNDLGKYSKIRITLDKYMELTKTKDKKTARKTIEEACDRLYEISFATTVKQGKETQTYKGRLFQSQLTKQRGGIYEMEFSNNFLRYCATTTPAAFHKGMYQINGKTNPYAWSIGEKLRWYYEINRGRGQSARLSVAKLLEAVPDIPTYDEVMQTNRHVTERIISPVERDLDELQKLGVLKSWEYSNAKGLPLTREQVESMDYDTWSKLYIAFELNLPPQEQYIEQHQKRIAKAKERAAKIKAVSKNGGVTNR